MDIFYQGTIAFFAIVIIVGVFQGYGENRSIIVYSDYDDLGLTFSIPASFFLISYISTYFGLELKISFILGSIVSFILTIKVFINTYNDNDKYLGKTLLSFFTKLPLSIIWILSIISVLDPTGKTANQRRKNRATAMVILAFLTPIIAGLIVNKTGSLVNPKSWFKGRRIGDIRNHL